MVKISGKKLAIALGSEKNANNVADGKETLLRTYKKETLSNL
jgi:hypothetical protein